MNKAKARAIRKEAFGEGSKHPATPYVLDTRDNSIRCHPGSARAAYKRAKKEAKGCRP